MSKQLRDLALRRADLTARSRESRRVLAENSLWSIGSPGKGDPAIGSDGAAMKGGLRNKILALLTGAGRLPFLGRVGRIAGLLSKAGRIARILFSR
jgi:hypothetical protein